MRLRTWKTSINCTPVSDAAERSQLCRLKPMPDHQYSIMRAGFDDKNCVVGPDDYTRNAFQIAFGKPAGPKYPDDVRLPMTKSPGKATPDALHNTMRFLLASQRLTEILRRELTGEVEYLPFTLLNHK